MEPNQEGGLLFDEPVADAAGGKAGIARTEATYRVLARKYRPANFGSLIGQDAMVRTLSNAFAQGRIAHGFILTGVRGVGKTTTARIIAKGLNCIGPMGTDKSSGGPTIEPCGQCEPCRAITESRHIDVLEMDAASHTGIDDIREIIDGARYAAVSARYKVYIIDEVHMLSKAAFNGLLKTLEEPPPHVVFVFATTEIRKVPVTVLSRCQRFDLKRVEPEVLIAHLAAVARAENAVIEPGALALIARAAEGSVRDGLSLLDQAISLGGMGQSGQSTETPINEDHVRDMLGLVDRGRVLDLFEAVMAGNIAGALQELASQYASGADPLVVLQDLLGLVHWVTRLKLVPEAAADPTMVKAEIARGRGFAESLPVNVLTRAWSLLLKGIGEVQAAPLPLPAAEMVLVRLAFAADLPTPDEALRALSLPSQNAASRSAPGGPAPRSGASAEARAPGPATVHRMAPRGVVAEPALSEARVRQSEPQHRIGPVLDSLEAVVARADAERDVALKTQLEDFVHLVAFEPGRIEFRPAARAPADLAGRLAARLQGWTGERWTVTIVSAPGAPTLSEARQARARLARDDAARHPMVAAVLAAFPGASITQVRETEAEPPADQSVEEGMGFIENPDDPPRDEDE